jgi:hypothetical protein
MPKFRKRPVVVEARQIWSYLDLPAVEAWVNENGGKAVYGQQDPGPAELLIDTLEGVMTVQVQDWVINGVAGEFYPCKDAIFKATYEPVEEAPDPEAALARALEAERRERALLDPVQDARNTEW